MQDSTRKLGLRYSLKIPELRYLSYALLVNLKRALGLSTRRHRTFYVWKFIRLIRSGQVNKARLQICAEGKSDGVGAQALAKFSAMCMAEGCGIPYVHRPFLTLAHAEIPHDEWVRLWEEYLEMGNVYQAPEITYDPVRIEDYVSNPEFWQQNVLLSSNHYHAFCEIAADYGQMISEKIRRAFHKDTCGCSDRKMITLSVHIRRGDVRIGDPETQHRFTTNDHILNVIRQITDTINRCECKAKVRVFSNGELSDFEEFRQMPEIEMNLGMPALKTFEELVNAQILFVARSDFSHLAAIYSDGIVICDPRHRTPLPSWLCLDSLTYKLQEDELLNRIKALVR
jgi:hypothetical protein